MRDFNSVSEPVAEMIGEAGSEDLGFIFETAEGARVHHAVAVALEIIAVGVSRLGVYSATALLRLESERPHRTDREVRPILLNGAAYPASAWRVLRPGCHCSPSGSADRALSRRLDLSCY